MRNRTDQLYITFHTTAAAMAMEKYCAAAGIPGRLGPVPRVLSADCGIAWCSAPEQRPALEALLAQRHLEYEGIHEILISSNKSAGGL